MDATEVTQFLSTASTTKNVLNYFRSYTYNWTLSAVPEEIFLDEFNSTVLGEIKDKYVVARSGGKQLKSISKATTDASIQGLVDKLVTDFDQESPGRFNFYFDRVDMTNLMGFDESSGYSQASKIEFTIVEPYGMTGFFEALQTSAIAAGYLNYGSACFMLTLEFRGYYADEDPETISDAMTIDQGTRYFPIQFTKVNIRVDESGSRYDCACVPINEFALSTPNKLLKSITLTGNTVAEVLQDFETQLNDQSREASIAATSDKDGVPSRDYYQIRLPKKDAAGKYVIEDPDYEIDLSEGSIGAAKAGDVKRQNINYPSKNPAADNAVPNSNTRKTNPETQKPSKSFAAGENIHDCIASIVRDSTYADKLFDGNLKLDEAGRFDYFNIGIRAKRVPKGWDLVRNKPTFTYIYYVIPYKMHISRVPGMQGEIPIDLTQLLKAVRRDYNYTYTGKNLDVLKLSMNYNMLYFQSVPPDMGNYRNAPSGQDAAIVNPLADVVQTKTLSNKNIVGGDGAFPIAKLQDPKGSQTKQGASNANPPSPDPYTALKNNLHRAILNNVGARDCTIEILGDPFYLVQSGVGNLATTSNDDAPGITKGDASADFQAGDIYVLFTVNRALDYDDTGIMKLNSTSNFSGLYRVNSVDSSFKEGVFTQVLRMLMIDGQPDQTGNNTTVAPDRASAVWGRETPDDLKNFYG